MAIFQGLPNLEGIKRLYLLFFHNHSPSPPPPNLTFVTSSRKIGNLSFITSCLLLPGFLMDALFIFQAGSENYHIEDIVLVL